MNFDKKTNTYRIIMTIIITALITFLITAIGFYNYYMKTDKGNIQALTKYIKISDATNSLSQKIELVKKYLNNYYIGNLNEDKMLEGAIKGYVEGLEDKYTEYLTQDELEELMISVDGNYVGIGIYMTETQDGEILVLLPIEGSPAEEADIKTGDIITKIDDVDCSTMSVTDASNMIKGEEETTVKLEILRDEEILVKEVQRRTVELKYIDSKMLENNIGYIQLLSFDSNCTDKFNEEYKKLEKEGMKALIIDLRDNGGGLVEEAISMSELFVPKGKVIMKSYNKQEKETVVTSKALTTKNIPIVVIVNENSASATEIFAAAIKENNLGKIVGTKTFGKGIMQEIESLTIGGALKITIEEFKTPNGNKINNEGITPDVEIENTKQEQDIQLQKAIDLLK